MDKNSFFSRNPLKEQDAYDVSMALQKVTVNLIDLALISKQAHWNIYGSDFLSVHTKLDDVVETAREGTDIIAERIVQLGHAPDGRAATVSEQSELKSYPDGFQKTQDTLTLICDRLYTASQIIREAIKAVSEKDPLSDDLLQPIGEAIEEHLWMMQSLEKSYKS
jgi:starvation-inducible DNA-binding protein